MRERVAKVSGMNTSKFVSCNRMKKLYPSNFLGKFVRNFLILFLIFFFYCNDVEGININLSEKDIQEAIDLGFQQKSNITKHLEKKYVFKEASKTETHGIVRTKWSKLALISGTYAEDGRHITKDQARILTDYSYFQIDIDTHGDNQNFYDNYKVHLIQKGQLIEPEQTKKSDVTHLYKMKYKGYARHCVMITVYFAYEKIFPNEKAEVVLIKGKDSEVFKINLADYK